ncbi:MAG: tripartite tricarboxylate transporter substrate binding protein [Proteobacteria bacterium]|nr:tripartite tricarboxylate transporter substrate binding protein [Burkholderiales bacterium]
MISIAPRNVFWLCGVLLFAGAPIATAQGPSSKALRLIVPYPAGGGTDALARTLAPEIAEVLGQPVIVDNRPGANGIIGSDAVARAKPDGSTLLLTIATHAINPLLYSKLPYDTDTDFVPVTLIAEYPFVLVVNPALPVKSAKELIALARKRPGAIAYASSGNGSGPHLGMELFASMAGVEMIHVPYKGASPATTDLLGGQVQAMLNNFLASASLIRAGRLRPLAVTGARRSPAMPELPTLAESGLPGYDVNGWYGLLAPRGTTAAAAVLLQEAVAKALRRPAVAERLAVDGALAVANTPAAFTKYLQVETDKWAKVIKRAGLKPETL